jgi:hypothetical protein
MKKPRVVEEMRYSVSVYKLLFKESVIPRLDRGIQFFNRFWIVRLSRTMTENDFVNKFFFDYFTISPSPYFAFFLSI